MCAVGYLYPRSWVRILNGGVSAGRSLTSVVEVVWHTCRSKYECGRGHGCGHRRGVYIKTSNRGSGPSSNTNATIIMHSGCGGVPRRQHDSQNISLCSSSPPSPSSFHLLASAGRVQLQCCLSLLIRKENPYFEERDAGSEAAICTRLHVLPVRRVAK